MRAATPFLLLLALTSVGCSKAFDSKNSAVDLLDSGGDDTETGSDTDTDTGSPGDTYVLAGVVVGADALPLEGVTVSSARGSVTTGTDGTFSVQGKGAATVTFVKAGRYTATREYTAAAGHMRVGLLPRRAAAAVDVSLGGTVSAGSASLVIPAAALGDVGMDAVTLDPLDVTVGLHALPAGVAGEGDQVASIYGAVVIGLESVKGAVTASSALTVSLPLDVDAPGGAASVLVESGGVWTDTGANATIASDGTRYIASFTVTEGGTYAVGELSAGGCASGTVVDGNGSPADGAIVRAYVRPVAAGAAGYLGETTTAADGTFCAPASGGGVTLLVDYVDGAKAVWSSATTANAGGDAGNVQLELAGCATGNLYAADGSQMVASPFVWEEGDVVTSDASGGTSTITFYARAGNTFHLVGPGGLTKAFSTTAGTTPETANCARLGNLQAVDQCVMVDVSSGGVPVEAAEVSSNQGGWSSTDDAGEVCVASSDGTTTFTAAWLDGAQPVVAEQSVDVTAGAGSCQSGECFPGPSLAGPESGCVSGIVRGEGGVAASGVTVYSADWTSEVTGADGAFTLTTAGTGTGAVWADDWGLTPFTDGPSGGGCASVNLFADAGAAPALVIASGKNIWRMNADYSRSDLKLGAVVDVADISVDTTADLAIGLLNVYAWAGDADGVGWDYFDYPSGLWSAVRIAPDGGSVAMQGYGASNSAVWIYKLDGTTSVKLSTTSGTDTDGLAWSDDSAWVASTRKDGGIEVTPANASRGPTTIAASPCAHPVWFDTDTVALECSGDMMLYEMDGSSSVSWYSTGGDERIWAVTAKDRVVYTRDEELHIANIDDSSDTTLYVGTPGTTYAKVRANADGTWIAAVVKDPSTGTDVLEVADQAPYTITWATSTPSEVETAVDWPD